jgi:hypothetical protein
LRLRISTSGLFIAAAALIVGAQGAEAATLTTSSGCAVVGQPVTLSGSGFGGSREYIVTMDGVYFGEATTTSGGRFLSKIRPGGLGVDQIQQTEQLEASDGSSTADTTFTLTRATGARFLATKGSPTTLSAPFQAWGMSLNGARRTVYLHYVSPAGAAADTVTLGRTSGQCGYLQTKARSVFPFTPTVGHWTLQFDTRKGYSAHPGGAVARIRVDVA